MLLNPNRFFVKKITIGVFFVVLFLMLVVVNPVNAQSGTPPTDDEVNAIAKQLFCPVCENIPLDVCPTQACAQWRDMIREKLSEGWTEDQIKQLFVDQYGDRVLAEPPRTGLNWLVYILPPLIFLIGIFVVYRILTSMKKSSPKKAASQPTDEVDPYFKKMEEALKTLEKDEG